MTSKASRSDQRKENFTRNIQFHAKKKRKREKIGSNKKNKNNFPRHEGISVCNNISTRGFPPITILLLYWIPPPFDLRSGITGIRRRKPEDKHEGGRERERDLQEQWNSRTPLPLNCLTTTILVSRMVRLLREIICKRQRTRYPTTEKRGWN